MTKKNPQIENGYTKLANELLEELVNYNLTKNEYKIALMLYRLSYGIKGSKFVSNIVTNKNLSKLCGIAESRVSESLKGLLKKNLFTKDPEGFLIVNKHYETWGESIEFTNLKITKNVISEQEKITENVITNYEKRKNLITENVIRDAENPDGSIRNSLYKKKDKRNINKSSSYDINNDQKKDDDDFIKNSLFNWGVVAISALREKHSDDVLNFAIKETIKHNPKNPGAYFRSLLTNAKELLNQVPEVKKIDDKEASELMNELISSGNFELKNKLAKILKNDDLDGFVHLKTNWQASPSNTG